MILNGNGNAFIMIHRIGAIFGLNFNINNVNMRACNNVRRLQVILAYLFTHGGLFRAKRKARQIGSGLASITIAARRRLTFHSVAHVIKRNVHGITAKRDHRHGGHSKATT